MASLIEKKIFISKPGKINGWTYLGHNIYVSKYVYKYIHTHRHTGVHSAFRASKGGDILVFIKPSAAGRLSVNQPSNQPSNQPKP